MKNRYILLIFFSLLMQLTITSCKDKDPQEPPFLTVEKKEVSFSAQAGSMTVDIKTNISDWSASVATEATGWMSVKTAGNKLTIYVLENDNLGAREGQIYIVADNLRESITVKQLGQEPEILVSSDQFIVEPEESTIKFEVTSNIDYELITPRENSWIKREETTSTRVGMVTLSYVYSIDYNSKPDERTGKIIVKQKNGNLEKVITITQKGITKYEGADPSNIKDDIKVPVSHGKASSFQQNENIEKSFDGDMNTLYHSSWNNKGTNYFPITLDYFFENQEQIDYFIYYPRSQGHNGNFKETEIWIATESAPGLTKLMDYDFKGSSSATKIVFERAVIKPTQIRFVVKSGAGDGQGFASCAEMEFYRTNPDNFDPLILFTDLTCSELKPGITLPEIEKVTDSFYRTIALYMYHDTYPREFRIDNYKAWPHPDDWARVNKTSPLSLLDNPTGISVEANEDLVVFVGDTHGHNISIKIQNLNKPGGDGYGNASYYPLSPGINKLKTRNKGLVYLFYHTPDYTSAPAIKVHFATGKVNGYFDTEKHNAADWSKYLNAAVDEYFDVLGEHAHLTFPTKDFKQYASDNGDKLIAAFDDLVRIEKEFMGLMKYNRPTINRAYFHAMYHSYMYSTSYRTAYNISGEGVKKTVMDVHTLKSTPWGPAHEQGHSFQTRPGFKWHGMTEVSNNVHSLIVQTRWGNPSRLQDETMGRYNNRYEKAYFNSFISRTPHPGEGDVFCKLVSLWQLQLYFADAQGYNDFYMDLFEHFRISPSKETPGEQQLEFVKKVCDITKINLIPFFERWGYLSTFDKEIDDYGLRRISIHQNQIDKTIADIKAKNYPLLIEKMEYICDENVEIFKQRLTVEQGSATISGKRLTMSGWKNVIAYEVYEKDRLVFASNHHSFELDNIPTKDTKVYALAYDGKKTEVHF